MPVINPSSTTLPLRSPMPDGEGNTPSPKRSLISRSLNRMTKLLRPTHGACANKAQSSHPQTVSVDIGRSVTLNGGNAALSTEYLSYCSALAVLSDWNGTTFDTRTLMHLNGSSLEHGLFSQDAGTILDTLKESLARGGKVIWVGGLDSQTDFSLRMSLEQTCAGRQPLLDLLETPGVSTTIAGASGVEIKADGTVILQENKGRGVLSEQEVRHLCHFA